MAGQPRIKWNASKKEVTTITKIVKRAARMNPNINHLDAHMDITSCHCNGSRLKLNQLLKADSLNFAYDVFGIFRNINRSNGKLDNCFVPRYAEGH